MNRSFEKTHGSCLVASHSLPMCESSSTSVPSQKTLVSTLFPCFHDLWKQLQCVTAIDLIEIGSDFKCDSGAWKWIGSCSEGWSWEVSIVRTVFLKWYSDCYFHLLCLLTIPSFSLFLIYLYSSLLQLCDGKGAVSFVPIQWDFSQLFLGESLPSEEESKGTIFVPRVLCSVSIPRPPSSQFLIRHTNRCVRRS